MVRQHSGEELLPPGTSNKGKMYASPHGLLASSAYTTAHTRRSHQTIVSYPTGGQLIRPIQSNYTSLSKRHCEESSI